MDGKEMLEEITNATSSNERDYLLFKYYDIIREALERKEELEKENQVLKKITQKMLNGLNNIVECKPKEIRGFILLFIEEFEDRLKEVLFNE